MTARERFGDWVKDVGVEAAAKAMGCHRSFVSHVRSGRKSPGLEIAARIERATHTWPTGPILASEWSPAAPDEAPATGTDG